MSRVMNACACPESSRRRHASAEVGKSPSAFGIVRVPGVPSAWHDWQAPVLTMFSHSPWLLIFSSGNSRAAGTRIIENQYTGG